MVKQLQKLLFLAAMLFVPWVTQAQTLEDYSFLTGVDTTKWIDMSSATQILTPANSDGMASTVQNIGFSFPFRGNTYTQYSVNTDGNLRLGPTATSTSYYSSPFSSTNSNQNNPKINAFGCDGYGVSSTHYVKALDTVDAGNDTMLVVERYSVWPHAYNSPGCNKTTRHLLQLFRRLGYQCKQHGITFHLRLLLYNISFGAMAYQRTLL